MPAAASLGRSQGDRGPAGRSGASPPDPRVAAGGRSNQRIETGGVNVGNTWLRRCPSWVRLGRSPTFGLSLLYPAMSGHSTWLSPAAIMSNPRPALVARLFLLDHIRQTDVLW